MIRERDAVNDIYMTSANISSESGYDGGIHEP